MLINNQQYVEVESRRFVFQAMPHACRALTRSADAAPQKSAADVLSSFIGQIADHLVRVSLLPEEIVTRPGRRLQKTTFASIHDQWLHALAMPDGAMEGNPAELERLAGQIRDWRRPITISTAAPFRLCFRLEEPEEDKETRSQGDGETPVAPSRGWQVRYLLQAADDPSAQKPPAKQ